MPNVAPFHKDTILKALNTAASTTPEIDFTYARGGTIFIPTGSSITTLTYWAAEKTGGTYLPLQDATGTAVTQTVAQTKCYDLPAATFGVSWLKIVVNTAGSVYLTVKG